MSLYRHLLRHLRHLRPATITNFQPLTQVRLFAFSSAEEAAAERRRRKRRLRIEPPLHALNRGPRPPPDPNAPRMPETTSSLVGPRLSLHNNVQSLIRSGNLDKASATARQAVFSRTRPTVFTCNAVMAAHLREGRKDDVPPLFEYFYRQSNIVPNVVSYNILINSHCDAGRVDVALEIYREILEKAPFSPSAITYRHLTKGLVDADRIQEAMDLMREMINRSHGADSLVFNILMKGFIDRGNMEKAYELFDELKERCSVYDGVVHKTFMEEYWRQGKDKEAMENYQSLIDKEFNMPPATCNVLLDTLLKHDKDKEADKLFQNMLDRHNHPATLTVTTETYNIMVNRQFELGKFKEAIDIFHRTGRKPLAMDDGCFNNIIGKLCENNMFSEAEKLFEEMPKKSVYPDIVTFEYLVNTCFKEGRVDDALKYFYKMLSTGDEGYSAVRINTKFYNKMYKELVKVGYIAQAMEIFGIMKQKEMKPELKDEHKPVPNAFTFETLINGLCKVGNLDQAQVLLQELLNRRIDISSEFREFVIESFEKSGRGKEVEQLLEVYSYFKEGRVDDALKSFHNMLNMDVVKINTNLYNKMYDELVRAGYINQAMEIFEVMKQNEMKSELNEQHKPVPNDFTYGTLIYGSINVGNFDQARVLLEEMLIRRLVVNSQFHTFVIDSFRRAGRGMEVEQMFAYFLGSSNNNVAQQAQ